MGDGTGRWTLFDQRHGVFLPVKGRPHGTLSDARTDARFHKRGAIPVFVYATPSGKRLSA